MFQLKSIIFTSSAITIILFTSCLPQIANANTQLHQITTAQLKQKNQSYIGLRYQTPPRGLKHLGGWIIGDPDASRVYGISHVFRGSQEMLWLEIVSRDSQGNPSYQVIDVLYLPKRTKSEVLGGAGGGCFLKGVNDQEVVAIFKYQHRQYVTPVKKAWRANRKTDKFEEISAGNISCENLDFGP